MGGKDAPFDPIVFEKAHLVSLVFFSGNFVIFVPLFILATKQVRLHRGASGFFKMLQKISYLRREPVGATTAVGVWEHTETRTTRTTSNSNLYENVKATASNLMREQASWKTALRILEEKANRSVQLNYKQEDALQELRMQRVSLITQLENQKAEYQRLKFDLVEIIGQCSTFKASLSETFTAGMFSFLFPIIFLIKLIFSLQISQSDDGKI